jgi:N-acetylmuramoyl-L-alanine amidase
VGGKGVIVEMVTCLALNVYHEARGEPIDGQYAVAQVTLNRVAHPDYPDDVCSVVYEDNQFSWVSNNPPVNNPKAYHVAKRIAIEALGGSVEAQVSHFAMWYHTVEVAPHWASEKVLEGKIGNHLFYRAW